MNKHLADLEAYIHMQITHLTQLLNKSELEILHPRYRAQIEAYQNTLTRMYSISAKESRDNSHV